VSSSTHAHSHCYLRREFPRCGVFGEHLTAADTITLPGFDLVMCFCASRIPTGQSRILLGRFIRFCALDSVSTFFSGGIQFKTDGIIDR